MSRKKRTKKMSNMGNQTKEIAFQLWGGENTFWLLAIQALVSSSFLAPPPSACSVP